MITAVLDTNVIVQSLISSPPSASVRVLDAYYDRRFQLIYSPATVDELLEVLLLASIRQRHQLSDDEVLEFVASLVANARQIVATHPLSHALARDITDTKFLSLAEATQVDYLVTNDRRHLLRLRQYHNTQIVTPTQFLRNLD